MATTKKTEQVAETAAAVAPDTEMEELVDFYRPPLPYENASQQINLTLNGVTVSYLRGNHVKMKKKFVKMVEQGEKEQMQAVQKRMKLQQDGEKNLNAMR